jgi:hypothetical protein
MADKSDRLKGGGFNLCSGRIKSDNLIEVLAVIHKRRHLEPEDIPRSQ